MIRSVVLFDENFSIGINRTCLLTVNFESVYNWDKSDLALPLNVTVTKVGNLGASSLVWEVACVIG